MRFDQLQLAEPILRAVAEEGYETATPIQEQAIPHVLKGRDVLGSAQTGTGKTAAFALPILHRLAAKPRGSKPTLPRALVLCPTRELATQISDAFRTYGSQLPLRTAVIFGGVRQGPQVGKLKRGVDVIIATPGRLMDLMNQGYVDLSNIEVLVLDESDRMLDMGFINDIRKIVAHVPQQRQTLLFSATMAREIRKLADALLRKPVVVQITPDEPTVDRVEQCVYYVDRKNKQLLLSELVGQLAMTRAIVFTRTKHGADKVVRQLRKTGINADAIHGNKSQNARQRSLDNFKADRVPVLVATDIASRGIDVDGVTHVVNYDITHEPETYVHRIGRTARAGAAGIAISFCDRDEVSNLRAIERLLGERIAVNEDHPPYPDGNSGAPAAPKGRAPHPLDAARGNGGNGGGAGKAANRNQRSRGRRRGPGFGRSGNFKKNRPARTKD
ncbi:MAG: DEAD/DEAH box helicase [Phycisphaeraceae bacterium]